MHKLSPRNMPHAWRKLCRKSISFPSLPTAEIVLAHFAARVLMDPVMRKRAMIPIVPHIFGSNFILNDFLIKQSDVEVKFLTFEIVTGKKKFEVSVPD